MARYKPLALIPILLVVAWLIRFNVNPTNEFVFLYVTETNASALNALPAFETSPAATFNPSTRSITVNIPRLLPNRFTKLLILREVNNMGYLVYSEIKQFTRVPAMLSLRKDVLVFGAIYNSSGSIQGIVPVVNNQLRAIESDIAFTKLDSDATVHFKYGGSSYSLPPGDTWVRAASIVNGRIQPLSNIYSKDTLTELLKNKVPFTVISLTNYGKMTDATGQAAPLHLSRFEPKPKRKAAIQTITADLPFSRFEPTRG